MGGILGRGSVKASLRSQPWVSILKVRKRSEPWLSGGRASLPDGDNNQGNEPEMGASGVRQAQYMGCLAGVRSRAERWESSLGRKGVYPTEGRAH